MWTMSAFAISLKTNGFTGSRRNLRKLIQLRIVRVERKACAPRPRRRAEGQQGCWNLLRHGARQFGGVPFRAGKGNVMSAESNRRDVQDAWTVAQWRLQIS
jgi:hypothetical protein